MSKKKVTPRSNKKILIAVVPAIIVVIVVGVLLSSFSFSSPPPLQNGSADNNPNVNSSENVTNRGGGPGGTVVDEISSSDPAILGFPVDVGENVGMVSTLLTDTEDKASLKFTAKYSGSVSSVVVNLLTSGEYSSNISAGLQEDNGGIPSGKWLGQPGTGQGQADENGFLEVPLKEPAQITAGKVYHLVIHPTDQNTTSGVRVRMYQLDSLVQPLNDGNLDKPLQDPAMNTLFYDSSNKHWEQEDNWPMYVIKYSNGKSEGQPYSLSAPWIIYGPRYVGQEFKPSSDYTIKEFGFSVSLSGSPTDKLYYEVRDSDNRILAKGLFAEANQIMQPRTFIKVKLDSPISLRKDELYRFVLLSPGTDLKKPYQLYGHEFTYDNKIGFGGLRHILTISYDSGSTWLRWEDADAIFDITKS